MADQVRITRLIQYVGDRDWVEDQLRRSIHGSKVLPKGIITAITLEEFPEKLNAMVSEALVASLNEIAKLTDQLAVKAMPDEYGKHKGMV